MSGGSYGYLCWQDVTLYETDPHLQRMADRLAGLGYASDAARETEELLLTVRQMRTRIEAIQARLAPLWKAVEWWDSADWGEERVHAALATCRGEKGSA